MLTTCPGKRDKVGLFNTDLFYDIFDERNPIGNLVYDKKQLRGALTLGGRAYTVGRITTRNRTGLAIPVPRAKRPATIPR